MPVVTNADANGLDVIAVETRALAEGARTGQLTSEEFSGGTFSDGSGSRAGDHQAGGAQPDRHGVAAGGAGRLRFVRLTT